jgi:hypothetical protein
MPNQIIELRDGNAEDYKQSNHILNFISLDELKKLDILELCKFADYHGWSSNLACHGGGCLFQFKHALYVLIYRNKFIEKFKENSDFIPDTQQTSIDRFSITNTEALKLQDLLININLKKYLLEIRFPNNLLFLGVIINTIGEKIEKLNRKSTIFLCTEFRKLFPYATEMIRQIDEIYFNKKIITWSKLEIFEKIVENYDGNRSLRRRRYY